MIIRKWLERRFWDFRHGHGTYLAYAIGLFNFIVINYYLLISNVPLLERIFPRLWIFAILFTFIYFPVAVIVGWLVFRKRQYKTDAEVAAMENPFRWRTIYPSRETEFDLPLEKLNTEVIMRLAENHNLLTKEEKKRYKRFLHQLDRLMEGESIEK